MLTYMDWLVQDRMEFLDRPCLTRSVVYGGTAKNQRRGLQLIPAGTEGVARVRVTDGATGTQHVLCTFEVGTTKLWARCAPSTIMIQGDSREPR